MTLNERAWKLADRMEMEREILNVKVTRVSGTRIVDCGDQAAGGLAAGILLSRICLSDLGEVSLTASNIAEVPGAAVQVSTDHPVLACLASQYAGWQVKGNNFFAMASGPVRAVVAREEIFKHIPGKEESSCAVGVLETRRAPNEEVLASLIERIPTTVEKLTLLYAPAASIAGTIQVVARSIETALHKLHQLKFDVTKIVSGFGTAPLPPVAKDELAAIGRTNDAILYGARVTLWVRAEDGEIESIGPQVPSESSKDHGSLFSELFARYGDFYKIDPMLFSPAKITFVNLKSGRAFSFGHIHSNLLRKSFLGL